MPLWTPLSTPETSTTSRDVALEMLKLHVLRLNHIEELLLGMGTLAIAGWGFFYATQAKARSRNDEVWMLGRTLFAVLFSGLVGTAFSSLYIGRMGINLNLLRLEQYLNPEVRPHLQFLLEAGKRSCLIVYAAPALFMPTLALGAIGFSAIDARSVLRSKGRRRLVYVAGFLVALPVLFTGWRSLVRVREFIESAFRGLI